jgi:membrane fusion protein, heavy metal efflux system
VAFKEHILSKTNLKPILILVVISAILGGLILNLDNSGSNNTEIHNTHVDHHGHEEYEDQEDQQFEMGPKGGKLFTTDNFGVEVTIYEKGVPPQFRIFLYENAQPISPAETKVALTLSRLGRPSQLINFQPEDDYLVGDQVVEEPHSFEVAIATEWQGKTYHWGYSQIEMRVELSNKKIKRTNIEVKTAEPAVIRPTLQLPGQTAFNYHNIVRVVPRVPGIVDVVNRHKGMQVKEGEVLAVIESQMLAELRSQFLATQRRLDLAYITFEREKKLWQEKITAEQDYLTAQQLLSEAEIMLDLAAAKLLVIGEQPENVREKKNNLNLYEIRAPISGLIITETLAQGAVVKEDTEIFTLVDISTMYANLMVYPKDISAIKLGQQATITAVAQDVTSEGTVSFISAFVNEQTRTTEARITLDNTMGQWKAGMFINASLLAEEIQAPVAISVDALQTLHDMTVVFGRYGDYFEARPVTLGRSDGKMVEVLSGLLAGERYAAGNSFAIKAELGKSGASHVH